ncbi:MAG: hypothetical protein RIM99_00915 [Cyclobacteriaceae bacterium]
MKAYPLLFALMILTIISGTSCVGTDQGTPVEYQYILRNESGVPVLIEVFQASSPEVSQTSISLNDSGELIRNYTDRAPYSGYSFLSFFGGDSLRIVFNGEKNSFFSCTGIVENCRQERNPLNPIYSDSLNEEFIITPEDYQAAILVEQ